MSDPEPTPAGYHPTTTHASWGAGHPRLLVSSDYDRFVHDIDCDLTRVGSADDCEVRLGGTDSLHARITHDATDEYILEMVGAGNTSHGAHATLRTGAMFTAGPWHLVYARDEYGDHGRPYGGRNGGEGAHQRRQRPRPDYETEHPDGSPVRCELKDRRQGSSTEQAQAIRQSVLISAQSETGDDADHQRSPEIRVLNDEAAGVYEAVIGERGIGGVTYNLLGEERIALLAVSVFPEFRGQGVAYTLIHAVLEDVRAQGRTVTNYCPVVATFIDEHPQYADLIDSEYPGAYATRRRP